MKGGSKVEWREKKEQNPSPPVLGRWGIQGQAPQQAQAHP